MTIIDTHSHVYLPEFDQDRETIVERADKAGIIRILMPAIDSTTHENMLEIEKHFAGKCMAMMGLHPCSVMEKYDVELGIIEQHLSKKKFVAIGETGLDFYWDLSFKDQQYEVFQQQISWALQYNIPVVIHSRNSIDECIEMIQKNQDGSLKGVFHCFSGSLQQAKKIMELGFYMGIGGVITFKNSGLDLVMKEAGLSNVILETDAPYLAPVPYRGKRNEPSYLNYVVDKLASVTTASVEEVSEITTANAQKLFSI
ncbi:MAG: TatD family deoxyribonuclease [Bacteroidetes bacterium]|jgi:TatD DNase family protein|nr:MAG: TatD family deoxyribonuclease [Bacteroidota bacterium]